MDATMMINPGLTFCGFLLAERAMRHLWCNRPYRGVDARVGFDYMSGVGSLAWHVRSSYFESSDTSLYLRSLSEAVTYQLAFRQLGDEYAVMAVLISSGDRMSTEPVPVLTASEDQLSGLRSLGYDVSWATPGFHSFLYQPGFLNRQASDVQRYWLSKLNKHGLLPTLEDAREFRTACCNVIHDDMELLGVAVLEGQ
jgi:hypothetical protein